MEGELYDNSSITESMNFTLKSMSTLFVAKSSVDIYRDVYAQVKSMEQQFPANMEEQILYKMSTLIKNRGIDYHVQDFEHTYWDPGLSYDSSGMFGILIQFVDYHQARIPLSTIPPESDVIRYIDTVLNMNSPLFIDEQLQELLKITNDNLLGAIHLGFIASRFMARGMDTRLYPNIPIDKDLMLTWAKKIAPFEQYNGSGDSTGDTYYFWTHVFAGLFYSKNVRNNLICQTTFEYGTEIMVFVRKWIANLPTTSDHYEASLIGRNIGMALSVPDWYS